ncbi:MAG: hypothetical protein SFX74_08245 [Fimbriimonadaceae bacterium]|nr:hypothetical protein [Fimbriimonadaceae bacterium]
MNQPEKFPTDAQLAASEVVVPAVKAMPEDVPSMAWRSALNDRLREESAKVERKRRWRMWLPGRSWTGNGLAVAMAAAITFVMLVPRGPSGRDRGPADFESMLIETHRVETSLANVTGSGLSVAEQDAYQLPSDVSMDVMQFEADAF